jgi:hypothetical protein
MLYLDDVIRLYNEQLDSKDAVIIIDENSNILFMNSVCYKLTNAIDFDEVVNLSNKFVLYDSFDADKNFVNDSIIIQAVRKIKFFGDKNFWIYLNLIPTNVGNLYLLQCHKIDDSYQNILIDTDVSAPIDLYSQLNTLYENILIEHELKVLYYLMLNTPHGLILKKLNISRTTLNRIFKKISTKIFGEILYSKEIVARLSLNN